MRWACEKALGTTRGATLDELVAAVAVELFRAYRMDRRTAYAAGAGPSRLTR